MVIVRQRPETAGGIVFVSLEDETGIANLVVMPDVYERFRPVVRGAPFLLARGRVERSGKVVNVRVDSLAPLRSAPSVGGRAARSFRTPSRSSRVDSLGREATPRGPAERSARDEPPRAVDAHPSASARCAEPPA